MDFSEKLWSGIMISLIVIVIVILEIHEYWALMIVIIPKEVAESHRFTITTTFMARPRRDHDLKTCKA